MGQGQDTSIGAGSSQYGAFQADNPGSIVGTGGQSSGQQQPSFWDQIGQVLNDPETLKALSKVAGAHANMGAAQQALPPRAQQILKSGLQEFQQQKVAKSQPRQPASYLGDIETFAKGLPPEVAQNALQRLGIPGMMR